MQIPAMLELVLCLKFEQAAVVLIALGLEAQLVLYLFVTTLVLERQLLGLVECRCRGVVCSRPSIGCQCGGVVRSGSSTKVVEGL